MSHTAPVTVRAARQASQRFRRWTPPAADSLWWLALVAVLFSVAQLVVVVPRLGLSWDETVYLSQLSVHAPASYFGPPRARGVSLLAAPVTLLTGSVLAVRVYLAVLSGAGLFAALLTWRRLRPAWMLALAGMVYATLWVALYYGPQAMPDEWVAFSALAAVGCFLQACGAASAARAPGGRWSAVPSRGPAPQWRWLAGLAFCIAFAALVRPGDAVFLSAGLVIAVLAVRAWRHWQVPAALIAGLAAGCAEWVAEAYFRFGGPLARLHGASAEQGGFGLHAGFWDEFKAANGPTLCRPCVVGLRYPVLSLWWVALAVLALAGIAVARRAGRMPSSLLAALCALCLGFQYLFLINYAAPRFLLPAWALLAIPVADALAWLLVSVRADIRATAQVAVFLAVVSQVLVQFVVLNHQVEEKQAYFGDYQRIATSLRRLGVRPPCLVTGAQDVPIAYYMGCGSAATTAGALSRGERVAYLRYPGHSLPAPYRGWQPYHLAGVQTRSLRFTAYLPPGQPR